MILVSGSLAYDYIMDFPGYFRDHILPEKLHVLSVSFLIDKMERNFGGTAGNIAYNLALLGEKPTILASVGKDFGDYRKWFQSLHRVARGFMPRLAAHKVPRYEVDLSCVRQVQDLPTAGAYIMTDKSDNQITAFYPGAMANRVTCNVKRVAQGAKMAIVSPGNLEDMKTLPVLYKKYGVPYIYDPGQAIPALSGKDLQQGVTGARVFISNDYELAMVLKKTGLTERGLLQKVSILVTTLGDKGSIIKASNPSRFPSPGLRLPSPLGRGQGDGGIMKFIIPPAKPKNTSDPTGAGDAYRAGLIKGLLLGLPYDKVGKLASTVAVYTVEKYGTQTHGFTWRQVLLRYKTNYGESLV